ncbi:hypothetical protein PSTT_05880, partial [Puccinia striiformis]
MAVSFLEQNKTVEESTPFHKGGESRAPGVAVRYVPGLARGDRDSPKYGEQGYLDRQYSQEAKDSSNTKKRTSKNQQEPDRMAQPASAPPAPPPLCRAISPPTPAPSPQPDSDKDHLNWSQQQQQHQDYQLPNSLLQAFSSLSLANRSKFLTSLLPILNLNELTNLSARILPRLKRDFLRELPIEISLHILSFVDDPKVLMRAGMVSRFWRSLVSDEATWKGMCWKRGFNNNGSQSNLPLSLEERMEKERKGRVATYRAGVEERRKRKKSSGRQQQHQQESTQSSSRSPHLSNHPAAIEHRPFRQPDHLHLHQSRLSSLGIPTTTAGLGLGTASTENNGSALSQPSSRDPNDQQPSALYLTATANLAGSGAGTSNTRANQLPISRRNSFNDLPTSPRLDHLTSSTNPSTSLTPLAGQATHPTSHLNQRPSPLSSQPLSSEDSLLNTTIIKQPHKVINANSPIPGMVAPTDATSPRRTRPHSMPILGLSLNLTRSVSAFADFDHGSSSVTTDLESLDEQLVGNGGGSSSTNSQSTSFIPDHPDSAAWTPSSIGQNDLPPHSAASFYDDFEYSPRTPFSYKSYFKRAYLTESNWLRGPGELIAMQTSQNNDGHEGVVTSLGFDDDWIVVGMATSKIHVFNAHTGEFTRTLTGHELGVWCLALVGSVTPETLCQKTLGKVSKQNRIQWRMSLKSQEGTLLFTMTILASLLRLLKEEPSLSSSNNIPSTEWVSSTYHSSSYATNMMRGHGGLGMNSWTRDRHGSQDTTVRGRFLGPTDTGSIFQPALMTLDEQHPPPPLPLPVSMAPQEWPPTQEDHHLHQHPPPLQTAAPLPSFSTIPQPPSSASDLTSHSADLRQDQQQQQSGSTRINSQTPVGRPAAPRMAPLGFDYRRPRRPSSFNDYSARSASQQTHNGTPGGMGLGAGGPSAGNLQQASACGIARGWGQKSSLVVSGGCDRDVRVWDVMTGQCKFILHGHSSTIRCLKVLDGRPIAVSGSRDSSLRVWDIERGIQKHILVGHTSSVRAIEVHGNRAVSGSYDTTCRLWDVDTGECLKVLRGHYHQIYAVAFDGIRIASGSMDSTVCIWSASTGELIALLQGHTALVGQVQINGQSNVLVTGGSDGRVVIFSLDSFECVHRLCAHDNSVTCLQFDDRFVVTGGNDGRVKLWDFKTGSFIRELAEPCEAVWRITLRDDKAVLFCKREGKTVMEIRFKQIII